MHFHPHTALCSTVTRGRDSQRQVSV